MMFRPLPHGTYMSANTMELWFRFKLGLRLDKAKRCGLIEDNVSMPQQTFFGKRSVLP